MVIHHVLGLTRAIPRALLDKDGSVLFAPV